MRILTIITITSFLASCAVADFMGANDEKEAEKEEASSSGDEDQAADPVSVGGTYLGCFMVAEKYKEVGCAVRDKKTHAKRDNLLLFKFKWKVLDKSGSEIVVKSRDGYKKDPYHILYKFEGRKIDELTVHLDLEDQWEEHSSYHKDLSNLDIRMGLTVNVYIHLSHWSQNFQSKSNGKQAEVRCFFEESSRCKLQNDEWDRTIRKIEKGDMINAAYNAGTIEPNYADIEKFFGPNMVFPPSADQREIILSSTGFPCILDQATVLPQNSRNYPGSDGVAAPILFCDGRLDACLKFITVDKNHQTVGKLSHDIFKEMAFTRYSCRNLDL